MDSNFRFKKGTFIFMDQTSMTYHEQTDIDNTLRLREILKTLPPFAKDYFRAIEPTTSTRTRISYAYDIRVFFQFLLNENPAWKGKSISDIQVSVLDHDPDGKEDNAGHALHASYDGAVRGNHGRQRNKTEDYIKGKCHDVADQKNRNQFCAPEHHDDHDNGNDEHDQRHG